MYGSVPPKVIGVGFVGLGLLALAAAVAALLIGPPAPPTRVLVLLVIGLGLALWGSWFLNPRLVTVGLIGALLLAVLLIAAAAACLFTPEQMIVTSGRGPRTPAGARAMGCLLLAAAGLLTGVSIWAWRHDRADRVSGSRGHDQ